MINTETIQSILYTIITLGILFSPLIIYLIEKKKRASLIDRYLKVFNEPSEAYAAYERDQMNLYVEAPYKKRSILAIVYYALVFYIISEVASFVAIQIYLGVNGFSQDIINPNSPMYNQDVYNHMASILNLVLQVVIYGIGTIGVVIFMWKPFMEDIKKTNKKVFAYGAMGLGLAYGGNVIATIILEVLGVTEIKGTASNQEAINSMFDQPWWGLILLFIVIVILAPIIEELVFRKAIFTVIKNKNLALAVSSLVFGALHCVSTAIIVLQTCFQGEASYLDFIIELIYILPYSLMGLGLGLCYIKGNRNIGTSIFAHMLNNGISFFASILLLKLEETGILDELEMVIFNLL